MRLIRYKLKNSYDYKFKFDETKFARISLLVGDSGTGKTQFLYSIVNFFSQLISDNVFCDGEWDVDFEVSGVIYNYQLDVSHNQLDGAFIKHETLRICSEKELIFTRNENEILWHNNPLPKLSANATCFSLLKNENIIKPIYQNMRKILIRNFSGDALHENFRRFPAFPREGFFNEFTIEELALAPININFHDKMDFLKEKDISGFLKVVDLIRMAFPFIIEADVRSITSHRSVAARIFCIKEKNIGDWISCDTISSGMQKIFLLILDTYLLQESGVLLIDEYENSLGINAINFLPDLINSISQNCQFIITSHHPYIINNIPIESWKVFHRDGMNVHITEGAVLKEKYSHSNQEKFIQLINDPLYIGGIE
jgi:predicted ATPase